MRKRMEALNVETTDDGQIMISQDDQMDDPDNVYISIDQVETLIKWLQQAKDELSKKAK